MGVPTILYPQLNFVSDNFVSDGCVRDLTQQILLETG